MNKIYTSSSSIQYMNLTMVTTLSQFREEMNKLFPELGRYLELRDDTKLEVAISSIAKLVGYKEPESLEPIFPYLNNLWCYMQQNKSHYYYWIL